ncbi:glycosyltransferase family 2 protein [Nocardioides salarius]|uniref:glycosyltransferase n=1 Tax=Nocardioides salarius TaxID=374513 RepID=UPI0030F88877
MSDLVLAVVLLTGTLAGAWQLRDLRTVPARVGPGTGASRVSVVVPARDEEASLPALLAGLEGLDDRAGEVVVVDDGSVDATAEVALRSGATLLTATPPPPGWTGKAWACHQGARATSGDLLLFLDADTVLGRDALAGLLAVHAQHGGLVSVQPFHRVERAHEQLSAYFNVVALLASGAFARRPSARPMAFGPCLLTSRADYERAGTHAAVRAEILDDVELARAYDRAGLPVRCLAGGGSVQMRSYPAGLAQLVRGWTKNIASGASAAAPVPTLAAVLWLCVHHAVAVGLLLALVEAGGASAGPPAHGHPALWVAAWVVTAWHLRLVLRRVGSFRWWTWAVFPVALLAFDVVFARSLVATLRGSVRWRGREVAPKGREHTEEGA